MGDDQQGLALHQFRDGLLDVALVVCVHAGGCLVQDDNRGVLQDAAGDGDALPLPAGEACPALADHRVKPIGQSHHKVVAPGLAGRLQHFFPSGVWSAHGDVVVNGVLEEVDPLEHHTDVVHQVGQFHLPNVLPPDQHPSVLHVPETGEQVGDGGFAPAGGPHQGQHLVPGQ